MSNLKVANGHLLGGFQIQKDITFSNSTGVISLFAVTGTVIVQIIPEITTTLVPDTTADLKLGTVGFDDAMIVDSDSSTFAANGLWFDQTPDYEIESLDRVRAYIISGSNNVILTLSAQINSGAFSFYCYWSRVGISGKGKVVPA